MALPTLGLAVVLAVSPASLVHGDFDDDDGQPAPTSQCLPCQPAPTSGSAILAPAPDSTNYGCAEEYLGDIEGTHWYDVWKKCPAMTAYCVGGLIEGVPYDNPDCELCTTGGMCDPTECCHSTSRALAIQPRLAHADKSVFTESGHYPGEPDSLIATMEGFAELTFNQRQYIFKLYSVVTNYRTQTGETTRVRLIGVQVDPDTMGQNRTRRADWSPNEPDLGFPSTGSTVDHWIDVELPNADTSRPFPAIETQRFRVCTVEPVEH